MTENEILGFTVKSGCYSKTYEDFVFADDRNYLRLFDLKKQETGVKIKRISKFSRCFDFFDSDIIFFTFQNNSILVIKLCF
jgi:hypothetical protein